MNCVVCGVGVAPEIAMTTCGIFAAPELFDIAGSIGLSCDLCNKKWESHTGIVLDRPPFESFYLMEVMTVAEAFEGMVAGGFFTVDQAVSGFRWWVNDRVAEMLSSYREALECYDE